MVLSVIISSFCCSVLFSVLFTIDYVETRLKKDGDR